MQVLAIKQIGETTILVTVSPSHENLDNQAHLIEEHYKNGQVVDARDLGIMVKDLGDKTNVE